ncbi:hypothetical protein GALL_155190 [mine drainage metagenome]|uniref:Transmembrane protein (PGPGW) n=1 Tax=mine drainage metagenome TaxID=410659 RepID=A0A1J5S2R3_9ZZZZ
MAGPLSAGRGDEDGRHHRRLDRAVGRLERRLPEWGGRVLRVLRAPSAVWLRLIAGGALVLGGLFSFLPVLGLWMLPLGLILLAYDIPPLRRPVGRFLVLGERLWRKWRLGRPLRRRTPTGG